MSFDEGNLLGEQSDPVDTLTSTSDAGNSSRKSAGSNILFQAYFLPGESAQSQGKLIAIFYHDKVLRVLEQA